MKIRRLDDAITRKIAAGEVIERPASAVKELVENALDAKSESIAVELEEGGTQCITVRDDGDGMDVEDLRLCIERHATSKISAEDDLDGIATLGFRGEALASIAAVAHVQIVSRARDGEEAHSVRVSGDEIEGPLPAGRAPGTTVEVRGLFFNLPARAKFLGSPRTESFHANRVVHRFALAAPTVGWALRNGERSVIEAPSVRSLLDRIAQIYGADVARAVIPIEREEDGITISGHISSPDLKRGNRRDQLFCVNGRPVEDRGLSYVLASAYQGILRRGTYPLAVIRIDLPFTDVDVNVHPRKAEVHFSDPRAVQRVLERALGEALSSRYVLSPLLKDREGPGPGRPPREGAASRVAERTLPFDVKQRVLTQKLEREREKVRVQGDRRVIGQLHQTYLMVEAPDGLEVVDQHIAHERILYEDLRRGLERREISRQRFLVPVRIELSFESAEILAAAEGEMARIGIVLDAFGGGTFLLREYPSLLAERQAQQGFQAVFEGLIAALAEGEKVRETLFERLLTELACGAAIKAGTRLSLEEQQSLVEQLMALENPYSCPHGRPIIFAVSRDELDRRFQRS